MTVERIMRDIEEAARGDRRARYIAAGASGYDDPELFATVDRILQRAVKRDERISLLPELLGDDDEWRLQTSLTFSSHRPVIGPALIFVKRTVLLPMMRWLFDFSRENFRRQERVNRLLAACIEELALENARLRQELKRR